MAKARPARLVAVEVSEQFRNDLSKLDLPVKLELHGSDAKDMSAFLGNDSVDRVLAVNVLYFLHPLSVYAAELNRIMKPGARAVLACKRTATLGHSDVFKNKSVKDMERVFREAGFVVSTEFFELGGPALDYTSIDIIKPAATK
jgi:SAM-dependent methyltransferase